MHSAYITGTGIISPQLTWDVENLSDPKIFGGNRLTCIEPDYSQWLDVKQMRRMSRVMKMGTAAAKLALQNAGVAVPDAILTGTGLGCLEDTGNFLEKMIELKEDSLNPTPFIQSTHNTIGSHIAFLLQCLSYNQTYSHGAFSFESALLDGLLQLSEKPDLKILVGAADEITNRSHVILNRFGIFKKQNDNSLDIFKTKSKGTLHGEGSAWFVLSNQADESKIKVEGVTTLYRPENIALEIEKFIARHNLKPTDLDLVLSGKSGDYRFDDEMESVVLKIFPLNAVGVFKHLCGEYFTASSFSFWLAYSILKSGHVPPVVLERGSVAVPKRVMIYNRYLQDHHSLILLSKE